MLQSKLKAFHSIRAKVAKNIKTHFDFSSDGCSYLSLCLSSCDETLLLVPSCGFDVTELILNFRNEGKQMAK